MKQKRENLAWAKLSLTLTTVAKLNCPIIWVETKNRKLLSGLYFWVLLSRQSFLLFISSEKFAVSVESLPSALENIPPIFCDTCTKKGKHRMTSKVFCIQCDRKFCSLHQEVKCAGFAFTEKWRCCATQSEINDSLKIYWKEASSYLFVLPS